MGGKALGIAIGSSIFKFLEEFWYIYWSFGDSVAFLFFRISFFIVIFPLLGKVKKNYMVLVCARTTFASRMTLFFLLDIFRSISAVI